MAARSGLRRMLSIPGFAAPHARMFSVERSVGEDREVFVTGLSKHTSSDGLRAAFENVGKVVRAEVVTDPATDFNKVYQGCRCNESNPKHETRKSEFSTDSQNIWCMEVVREPDFAYILKEIETGILLDGWLIFAEPASLPIAEAYGSSGCRR